MTRCGHRGPVRWLFQNRRTGEITIAQFPNPALWLFLAATSLRRLFDPRAWLGGSLRVVATTALVWWSLDELARGVNPWRRLLGAAVLAVQFLRLLT